MFWLYIIYEDISLLKSFYILDTSLRTYYRILTFIYIYIHVDVSLMLESFMVLTLKILIIIHYE